MTEMKWKKYHSGYYAGYGHEDYGYARWQIRRDSEGSYTTWDVSYTDTFQQPSVHHRFVQTFWQLREAKAFCQWLEDGYSAGYIKRPNNAIHTFTRLGASWNVERALPEITETAPTNT